MWMPGSFCSKIRSNGSTHRAKSIMIIGHPCLTEHWIRIGPAMWPLIWTEEGAPSYMPRIRSINQSLNPLLFRMEKRYWWDSLSKASWKSSERIHSGTRVISACAIVSHTVSTASKIVLPGTPQNWLCCSNSAIMGRSRFTMMRAIIL